MAPGRNVTNTTTMEISMEVYQKAKNRPYDPTIPLLGIYLKGYKSIYKRDTCIPTFIAALFIITKLWNQLRYPTTNEWIKKMLYVHMCIYVIYTHIPWTITHA
jgi:hypothetical protein